MCEKKHALILYASFRVYNTQQNHPTIHYIRPPRPMYAHPLRAIESLSRRYYSPAPRPPLAHPNAKPRCGHYDARIRHQVAHKTMAGSYSAVLSVFHHWPPSRGMCAPHLMPGRTLSAPWDVSIASSLLSDGNVRVKRTDKVDLCENVWERREAPTRTRAHDRGLRVLYYIIHCFCERLGGAQKFPWFVDAPRLVVRAAR